MTTNERENLEKTLTEIFADLGSGKVSVIEFLQSDVFKTMQKAIKDLPKEKKAHMMNILGLQIKYDGNVTDQRIEAAGRKLGNLGKGLAQGFKGFKKAFSEAQKEEEIL